MLSDDLTFFRIMTLLADIPLKPTAPECGRSGDPIASQVPMMAPRRRVSAL